MKEAYKQSKIWKKICLKDLFRGSSHIVSFRQSFRIGGEWTRTSSGWRKEVGEMQVAPQLLGWGLQRVPSCGASPLVELWQGHWLASPPSRWTLWWTWRLYLEAGYPRQIGVGHPWPCPRSSCIGHLFWRLLLLDIPDPLRDPLVSGLYFGGCFCWISTADKSGSSLTLSAILLYWAFILEAAFVGDDRPLTDGWFFNILMRMYKSLDSSVMDAVWAKRIHPNSVFVLSYSPGIDYPSIYQTECSPRWIHICWRSCGRSCCDPAVSLQLWQALA